MAYIEERSGNYLIVVRNGSDASGAPIRKSMTYHPKEKTPSKIAKEVRIAALEFEQKVLNGKLLDGDKMRFAQVAERWYASYADQSMSPSIREEYRRILEKRIYPAIGDIPIAKIQPLHIQDIVDSLVKKGLAPSTIKNTIKPVQAVFKAAYMWRIVEESPCGRVVLPKNSEKYKYKIWTPEQVRIFFASLKSQYSTQYSERHRIDSSGNIYAIKPYNTDYAVSTMWAALFILLIYSSARRGEVCALTWRDIDFDAGEIDINKAVSVVGSKQIIKPPKTAAGKRRIYIPDDCIQILRKWRREQKELSLMLGDQWKGAIGRHFDENYVFIRQSSGELINVETVIQHFHTIISLHNASCPEEDRLPVIRLHDLRHTGASLMISHNVDILTVSRRLGHAKASTTLDIYSHALPAKDKEAAESLRRLIV